ncbi:protein NLRC3-like [Pholidichthys leucotaenia]
MLEQHVSANEDNLQDSTVRIKQLEKGNSYLMDKVDDLENRSRRSNLHLVGIKESSEGSDIIAFMTRKNVKILHLSQERKKLEYSESRVYIYPDFSAELIRRHRKFDPVKRKLHEAFFYFRRHTIRGGRVKDEATEGPCSIIPIIRAVRSFIAITGEVCSVITVIRAVRSTHHSGGRAVHFTIHPRDKGLAMIRTAFVCQVSAEILTQLIEALVEERVLNELEKEAIQEENRVRADKARDFIDTVRKKGEKACGILIKHLQIKDPSLSVQLRLSCDPSAQTEAFPACQRKLKSNLQKRFQCVFEGIAKAGNQTFLKQIYTELYITEGGTAEVNDEHEVRQIETASGKPHRPETTIRPEDIFKGSPGRDEPVRTVLTKGIAGIGKTVLTQKFTLDWAEDKANQDIQFMFPFTFRELNVLKEKKFSLVELVHHFFNETKEAGICSFDQFQVLFIFDGLDECRFLQGFNNIETLADVTESTSVDVLLTNLIRGKLLPTAHIWITTRPAAASQIPPGCIGMTTEVRGFNDSQKEEYFRKRFTVNDLASRIISDIKTSRSLHIMCHIPMFCWITATVLEDMLNTTVRGVTVTPKTLTELYIYFLVVQTKVKKVKYEGGAETDPHWSAENREMIKSLGKLAFEQLQKGNLIFYESDLTECGIDIREASVYSGVFTQIFREERGLYQDQVFCFIHLSVQEFLAALHVHLTFLSSGVNLLEDQETTSQNSEPREITETNLYQNAIDKALESPNGHLDLFLRFLLGLSLQTNQILLRGLMTQTGTSSKSIKETVEYINKQIEENLTLEQRINLFYCLKELNYQYYLPAQIQVHLAAGTLDSDEMSPAEWSALIFFLLSSEKDLEMFDLKKYFASEKSLLKLLPAIKASNKAILSSCDLSQRSCEALSSVLSSQLSNLMNLDLSNNDLRDSGVNLLCVGLKSPHCQLETLSLSGCLVSEKGCASLASALRSNPSHLRELDLRYNHPGNAGVKLLSAKVEDPCCRLDTLRVAPAGVKWLTPGVRKYYCDLTIDTDTVNPFLTLSDNNKKVTRLKENLYQPYPDHPDRFERYPQLLCRDPLAGRCYWEVGHTGDIEISLSYRRIGRKGSSEDCRGMMVTAAEDPGEFLFMAAAGMGPNVKSGGDCPEGMLIARHSAVGGDAMEEKRTAAVDKEEDTDRTAEVKKFKHDEEAAAVVLQGSEEETA